MHIKSKKLLAGLIIAAAVLMLPLPAAADTWQPVGTPGFSAGQVGYVSFDVYEGTPYVAFLDFADDGNKATVMKYVYGTGWENVGSPGFSTGAAIFTSLAIDHGTPYVAYADFTNGSKATVMKYVCGTGWETVGSPGFSAGETYCTSLKVDNNVPYVAYVDGANGDKATVMKYVYGTGWENVGCPGFSTGKVDNMSLYIDNGIPYVAYQDLANNGKITVMKYINIESGSTPDKTDGDEAESPTAISTGWEVVGTPGLAGAGSVSGTLPGGEVIISGPSLYVDNGIPYVAYVVQYGFNGMLPPLDNLGLVTVMKYVNGEWETVGTPTGITNIETMHIEHVNNVSLHVDNGTPYIAYSNTYGLATVGKYVPGTGWQAVGGVLEGILPTIVDDNISLSSILEEAGMSWFNEFFIMPLASIKEDFSGNDLGYLGTCSTGLVYNLSLHVDNGTPYVAYLDDANGGKATVMAYLPENDATLSDLIPGTGTLTPAFDPGVANYNISVGSTVSGITITPVTADSTASVEVNGQSVDSGLPSQVISLGVGNNTITVAVTAGDGTMKTYTITVNREPSGNDNGGSRDDEADESASAAAAPNVSASLASGTYQGNLTVRTDRTTATAILNEENINQAFNNDKKKTVSVTMPDVPGTNTYALRLPASSLTKENRKIKIKTKFGDITLPGNMLEDAGLKSTENVNISIGKTDKTNIPLNVQDMIGNRPVISLNITGQNQTIAWNNPDTPVTVSVPYSPTEEELKNPEHITVWYIDGAGNIISVPSGIYNPRTGRVTFTTTHFSHYAVAYVKKTFADLETVPWAKKQIEVLASKGIINGTSADTYSPGREITRADYLVLLVKSLGLAARVEDNFEDIKEGSYYYDAVGIAKKLGLTKGTGNNLFAPQAPITRQDMMVFTEKALSLTEKTSGSVTEADLKKFKDKSLIAPYAVKSAAALAQEGLVSGWNHMLAPLRHTTRAEAAALLYRIYNHKFKDS